MPYLSPDLLHRSVKWPVKWQLWPVRKLWRLGPPRHRIFSFCVKYGLDSYCTRRKPTRGCYTTRGASNKFIVSSVSYLGAISLLTSSNVRDRRLVETAIVMNTLTGAHRSSETDWIAFTGVPRTVTCRKHTPRCKKKLIGRVCFDLKAIRLSRKHRSRELSS